jgi:alkanesulfonate monooxygenase SsuD/methylene tetrahydromethanopterin reductase-like flavin-dependent oxidoreductase (luciferase family)
VASLEFGLLDGFNDVNLNGPAAAQVFDEHIEYAKRGEQLGYRYYFFIEHQNASFTCITAPSVYLAALARETSTLRFGPMVYQLPMHHPIRLAQDAAMVDQLSHGRLEFGVGYGTRVDEFRRWKVPFGERREMGVECLDIILKAWAEETVTYEGEYWSFDEALPKPKPYQQPHPPIWVGAHSTASFDYAAKFNYHVGQNIDVDSVAAEKFAYWRKAWESYHHPGPQPHVLLARHVHVGKTDEEARAEAEPYLMRGMRGTAYAAPVVAERPAEEMTPDRQEFARVYRETARSYDFWIDNGLAIVGGPETVARRLREQQEYVGYDVFLAQHQLPEMPRDLANSSQDLFGREVIPAFA